MLKFEKGGSSYQVHNDEGRQAEARSLASGDRGGICLGLTVLRDVSYLRSLDLKRSRPFWGTQVAFNAVTLAAPWPEGAALLRSAAVRSTAIHKKLWGTVNVYFTVAMCYTPLSLPGMCYTSTWTESCVDVEWGFCGYLGVLLELGSSDTDAGATGKLRLLGWLHSGFRRAS